jgi:(p)ppGpp synthase/HD superfamily hydrolase
LEIFNNTGEDIIVVEFNAKLEPTQHQLKNGQTVQIGIPSKLQMRSHDRIWDYDLKPIPSSFEQKAHMKVYLAKFQIEKDGEIYAMPPESSAPVTNFPVQPPHYPIKPQ